ncbi:uncharacterized protein LOC131307942 isoform X1 [Rhododendron vialii]|uniref:uncharacterized protein LOC131307942 isoform X1 n=2 Tax=Rhododendron vialii TaxID=182163 RepID=UPI00265E0B42|nr:uncharacterized protein LOC131307942 isoform X1 [Rhododendron vialii]XP_058190681.1 uncharacterized protein LOC131307942 isoform X1 [Rhododendron vialii]
MSDQVAQSYHGADEKSGQSVHSYQSVWMAHWTQTSFTAAPCVQDGLSLRVESNHYRDSPSAKGFTEVTEARTVRILNEGSSKNLINERLDCPPFPMFRLCQNIGSGFDPKNDPDAFFNVRASRPQIESNVEATQILPYRFGKGKAPVSSSFTSRQELNQLSSVLASKDHLSSINLTTFGHEGPGYNGPSALLVGEKKLDNHSTLVKSGTSVSGWRNACQSLLDPFAGNYRLPILFGDCSKKVETRVPNCFPSSSSPPPEATKTDSFHGGYSLQKMPSYAHNMESMRICSTKSTEGFGGGPGAFSQTTRNLLCMKKADVNLSGEKQIFRESNVSSKLKRNMFGELLSLSQPLGQNPHTLKLQPLGCSAESEGANNTEVEAPEVLLKNESSAETDTMDMDAYKEQNYRSGVNFSLSNKDIMTGQTPPFQPTITSTREEVGHRWPITTLPDINEEVPVLPVAGSSLDNEEPTTSRTQSLDAQHLLSHTEHPTQSKSAHCPDDPTRLEPGSRWLKRFKLSASDSFVLGTKSSNLGELPSHEKVNKLFGKIFEGSKSSSSETMSHKNHGKEERAKDQTAIVLLNGESSSAETAKKGQDILLSNPWIKRWCRHGTHQTKKAEAMVVCEPLSTKMEFDDLQNKQFPSIAAMALMGKAMSGFQPCKFQRRGSFVIWNSKCF